MKLQLSLDMVTLDEAIRLIEETKDSVDIVEVGTPVALTYGVKALSSIKEKFPYKELLADYKIIDGGYYEARIAFAAGADIVTVLGLSSDSTIMGAIGAAKEFHKQVMVDLIGVANIENKIPLIESLNVDYLCVHTAYDDKNGTNSPITQLMVAKRIAMKTKLAIAGGLNIHNIDTVVQLNPAIVVVGGGITAEPDRARAAADIKRKLCEASIDEKLL